MPAEDDDYLPCQNKANYADQRQASAAALVAKHQHGTSLKPYYCKYCGLWHLASNFDD